MLAERRHDLCRVSDITHTHTQTLKKPTPCICHLLVLQDLTCSLSACQTLGRFRPDRLGLSGTPSPAPV